MDRPDGHSDRAERLARRIEQVRGVQAASVLMDPDGQISEIHLVGSTSRRAKQVVRDVESLLYAQFGIHIDYRTISLVQLDAETVTARSNRLRLVSVGRHPERVEDVWVILQSENALYEGTAHAPIGCPEEGEARAAAQATLEAIAQATGRVIPLSVCDLRIVAPTSERVCLAIVSASTTAGEEHISGSCLVSAGALEAGCKATLDALNRRLPVWVSQRAAAGSSESGLATATSP